MKTLTAASAVVLLLAFAPSAVARRHAHDGEYRQIARALGVKVRCIDAWVSTRNRYWAAVTATNDPGCRKADGIVALRRYGTHWRVRWQGGAETSQPCSSVLPVPPRAARDLKLCGQS
jgi:hypothetical protein